MCYSFWLIQKSQGLAGVIFVVPGGSCSYSWYLIPWMLDYLLLCPGNFILKNYFKFEVYDEGSFFQVSGHTTYLGSPQSPSKDSVSLDRPGHVKPDHKQGCRLFYFSITLIQFAVSASEETGLLLDLWILGNLWTLISEPLISQGFQNSSSYDEIGKCPRTKVILTSVIWVPFSF